MKNEDGYILLTTLLLFVILMFLISKGFQLNESSLHVQQNQLSIFQTKTAALGLLQNLSQKDPHRLPCFSSSVQSPKPCHSSWHGYQFDYLAKFLSEDPCSLIEDKAADFYKITLMVTTKNLDHPITFEKVFALPGIDRKECKGQTRILTQSSQSLAIN